MFIEINDISTGTIITEPLNAYSINYVYSVEVNGKYRLIYMLLNGLRKIEEFDSQSDLEDRIDEIKELSGGGGGTNVYTYKGSCTFENLPTSGQVAGDVWNITNDFELDGKPYPAGTNVAWDGTGWDALAGSVDLSNYYTKTETDALFAETNAQINGLETVVGNLTFRGVVASNSFDTNNNEPGVYFVRCSSFSDGHGHSSTPTNYGFHPGTFFGVVYHIKKYDDANVGDLLGYVFGTTSEASNNGWVAQYKRAGTSTYISYSGASEPTSYTFLTTTTNQNDISGKKTFTTLPESPVVPTTDNQLVNKKYVDDTRETIQYTSMPLATSENVGQIVQYVGVSDANYTNGYFYKCTTSIDEQTEQTTYSWERISVQPESDMSNYYTKQEIDSMIGDITEVLSHLTVPTTIEQELSEI